MPSRRERGNVAFVAVLVSAALVLAVPLSLHVSQKRHDRLPLSVVDDYPAGRPFVQGEAYGTTLAAIVDHELNSGTGWRPNDFVLWGPGIMADNNANRQLGIIMAVRESTRVLKDHLTKVSSTEYDPNLIEADTAFRNDAEKFWLPSAESKFRDGSQALRRYVDGLRETPPRSKPITGRNVELIRLIQMWGDMLGDAHANLFKTTEPDGGPVKPWRNDDYFYHAQGVAHVIHHLAERASRGVPRGLQGPPRRPAAPRGGERLARHSRDHEAAHRARRRLDQRVRQPPPQSRRLHGRRAAEAVLHPRGAGEVGGGEPMPTSVGLHRIRSALAPATVDRHRAIASLGGAGGDRLVRPARRRDAATPSSRRSSRTTATRRRSTRR